MKVPTKKAGHRGAGVAKGGIVRDGSGHRGAGKPKGNAPAKVSPAAPRTAIPGSHKGTW